MQRNQQTSPSFGRVARVLMIPFCILVLIGCGHLDMYDQTKYNPYEESTGIYSTANGGDGAASRPILPNTQARNRPMSDDKLVTYKDANGTYVSNPVPTDEATIERGHQRMVIYCAPCHGELGNGQGIAASYFKTAGAAPATFYDPRLVNEADGYFFDVITNGKGKMFSYASRIEPADRWAIIAYIRTLQANPPKGAIPPTPKPKAEGTPAAGTPAATPAAGTTVPAGTAVTTGTAAPATTAAPAATAVPATTAAPTTAP